MMRSLFEDQAISVGELCRRLRQALYQRFPSPLRVLGEVSKCRMSDGHAYFSLKDNQGLVDCVCFRSTAERLHVRWPLADGVAVEVTGRVDIYERTSRYQLVVDDVMPVGQGALHLEFEALKERLRREGLFEQSRKRAIPAFIRDVAIVTSERGAALQDFLSTCRRRGAHVRVTLVHAPVQGAAAAPALARAIRLAGKAKVDVVVVARGGGSLEDLWAFNTEIVARAIVACGRPVITAIGHETDFSIADFVADTRAATPTAAAEFVAREREALLERIAQSEGRLQRALVRVVRSGRAAWSGAQRMLTRSAARSITERVQRLDDLRTRLAGGDPRRRARGWRQRIEAAAARLGTTQRRNMRMQHQAFESARSELRNRMLAAASTRGATLGVLTARLAALGPQQTLERGYAIVYDSTGGVLSDARRASAGDRIEVELRAGWIGAIIEAKRENNEKDDRTG
ncbi:MAG: exodeoxyribonuclease VII large subunit [Candidatus Eremiobacteraeota bacterium]|nr:exodeoxyribonuclease VII large subunit [Candidatus Eremiobacteraeota bacterium]